MPCSRCDGRGKVNCPNCNGSGIEAIYLKHVIYCTRCGGSGEETCNKCNGIGEEI